MIHDKCLLLLLDMWSVVITIVIIIAIGNYGQFTFPVNLTYYFRKVDRKS